MAAWLPLPSGFTGYATRFVDEALGFTLGWNYWFKVRELSLTNCISSERRFALSQAMLASARVFQIEKSANGTPVYHRNSEQFDSRVVGITILGTPDEGQSWSFYHGLPRSYRPDQLFWDPVFRRIRILAELHQSGCHHRFDHPEFGSCLRRGPRPPCYWFPILERSRRL